MRAVSHGLVGERCEGLVPWRRGHVVGGVGTESSYFFLTVFTFCTDDVILCMHTLCFVFQLRPPLVLASAAAVVAMFFSSSDLRRICQRCSHFSSRAVASARHELTQHQRRGFGRFCDF